MIVFRAFLFVTFCSFKNRILVRLRRLRNPRYLVSAVAGLGYFWFMFLRHSHGSAAFISGTGSLHLGELGRDCLSILILGVLLFAWMLPQQSGGVELSESEIAFLFPAPLTRPQILLYKLFRSIPSLVISVLFMMVGFRQARGVGILVGLGVMTVYFMMVAQARARLKLAGIGFLIRQVLVLLLAGFLAWVMIHEGGTGNLKQALVTLDEGQAWKPPAGNGMSHQQSLQQAFNVLDAPFKRPVLRTILFVPHLFASVLLPESATALFVNSMALLALGYLFFLIAARVSVSFEEASVVVSQRRTARMQRLTGQRSGNRIVFKRMPPPFRLGERGPAEVAIIWKNVTAAMRISSPALIIISIIFAAIVLQGFYTRESVLTGASLGMALFICAFFPFIGTAVFTQDLRLDLSRIELLKSFPLSGERLVAAEIAAPLLIVSVVELILLCITAVLAQAAHVHGPLAHAADPQFITLALLFAIPICAAQLVIRNATPLILPAWAARSKEEPRGLVMTGQRLVLLAGNLIVLSVVLLPAALLGVPAFILSRHFFAGSPVALAVATMPSIALLFAEVYFGIKALGAQFDNIDVTNDFDTVTP
jgi:ABC-2 type transport system permease protein